MGNGLSPAMGERSLRHENEDELSQMAEKVRWNNLTVHPLELQQRPLTTQQHEYVKAGRRAGQPVSADNTSVVPEQKTFTAATKEADMVVEEQLDLSNRFLGLEGARVAGEAIARNKTIKDLNLSYNKLGGKGRRGRKTFEEDELGITSIVDGLVLNQSLELLNLAGNNLGEPGCAIVARALSTRTSLQSLNLFNNAIDDHALVHISRALQGNDTLTYLNLDYNDITDEGAQVLFDIFKVNETITMITLKDNDNISDTFLKQLQTYLDRNKETQDRLQADREAAKARAIGDQAAAEEERARRKEELQAHRSQIEKEYRDMERQREQEAEERARREKELELERLRLKEKREKKAHAQEEHIDNLIELAYSWRDALNGRGSTARGARRWKGTMKGGHGAPHGADPDAAALARKNKRNLQACWCEPTDQTSTYAGSLHYHCIHEPEPKDELGDEPKRYGGCCSTPHRCRSAPIAEVQQKRNQDTLFGPAATASLNRH